jgi:hypothetical protein
MWERAEVLEGMTEVAIAKECGVLKPAEETYVRNEFQKGAKDTKEKGAIEIARDEGRLRDRTTSGRLISKHHITVVSLQASSER